MGTYLTPDVNTKLLLPCYEISITAITIQSRVYMLAKLKFTVMAIVKFTVICADVDNYLDTKS